MTPHSDSRQQPTGYANRLLLLIVLLVKFLLIFALGKVFFMLYNHAAEPFTSHDVWDVLRHGLSMDVSTAGYLLIVPWLFCLISLWWQKMPVRSLLIPYYIIIAVALSLVILGDAFLYEFWKFKLNASVFAYLGNPEGATSSVSKAYMLTRLCAIVLGLLAMVCFLLWLTPRRFSIVSHRLWRTFGLLLVGGLIFLGIRGGTKTSVMNVGVAYYSPRLFLNHAAVNPAFSLLSSIKRTADYPSQFNYLPEEERAAVFDALYPEDMSDVADTLLRVKRPNILLILMESYGGKFIEELGGLPGVSPNWSRLISEGVFWENFYANSFRTDRGTVSTFSGWISYPTTSLMRLPDRLNTVPSIAHSLRREGYATSYLYGGDIKFAGKQGYLVATGYETLISDKDFTLSEAHESKWGVNDSTAAQRTFQLIRQMPKDEPWHMVFQTLSSHEPFEVPYHRLEDKKLNAFAFTDQCVGQLVDSLKTLPEWDNMLVIMLPDHGYMYELTYEDPAFFHCPMLWLGGALREPRRMKMLMNQSDLPATLLAQMGIDHADFSWSRNVLSSSYTYPFVYSNYPSGILFADSTGVSVFDITSHSPITEEPSHSEERIRRAKALLQTSYDKLGEGDQISN